MRTMSPDEMHRFLQGNSVGHLATTDGEQPYVVAINYLAEPDRLFFATESGQKLRNLTQHPRVCLTVDEWAEELGYYRSVIVQGTAHVVTDPQERQQRLRALAAGFARRGPHWATPALRPAHGLRDPSFPADLQVVRIDVDTISGRETGVAA